MEEEEGAEDVDLCDGEAAGPAQEEENGDIQINWRQNTHCAAKVKAAHADGAALLLFVKQQAGNQITADHKEDKYTSVAIEDGIPDERNVVSDIETLDAVESHDEKNG